VRVIVGRSVLNLISVYLPQMARSKEDKEEFLAMLGDVESGIDSGERLLIYGDLNGHVVQKYKNANFMLNTHTYIQFQSL